MESFIPRGGNLFVTPVDLVQQKALLDLNQTLVADRLISFSLPKSNLVVNKGIIFEVPIRDDGDTILDVEYQFSSPNLCTYGFRKLRS